MKESMIMNVCSVVGGSIAIAVACAVTKSALPLVAYIIIPKWSYRRGGEEK